MKKTLSVIVPAYNEEGSIREVLEKLKHEIAGMQHEIIAVNDGSTDRTAEEVKKVPGVELLEHPENMGYGAAIKTGLRKARFEWILITDADGTYPSEDIKKLMEHAGDYDMVVGSRTGGSVHIPLSRKPAKFILSKMANFILGRKVPDLNSGMRIFRKDLAMRFMQLFPDGFSFTTTITLAAICDGYRVKYVPINYMKRVGKSSMKASNFPGFMTLLARMAMYFKPMKVFMPVAVALLSLAVVVLFHGIYYTGNVTDTAVILVFMAFQVGILGMLADIIVKNRDRNRF